MESLDCRSLSACATCPHSDRHGACTLEADLDLALESLAMDRPRFMLALQPRASA